MPSEYRFDQVDVFANAPFDGNPLAVVSNADELTTGQMSAFAAWTNLSETTFLMRPTRPEADYRVRIFTPVRELPFAGHPTLGSCHVWLASNSVLNKQVIVQECDAGLVRVRCDGPRLAFAAPPLIRSGSVAAAVLRIIAEGLGISPDRIVASQWADNGPGWVAVMLGHRDELLALRPNYSALRGLNVGVVAPWVDPGATADIEIRAFIGDRGVEDSVTGSLNASVAQWLINGGLLGPRYIASQGSVLGRRGRIEIEKDGGDIWVGGEVQECIRGHVFL